MENNIIYIGIDKLIPHPQNPRKQLGDLTELADSIKHSGVYQNLTVVDNHDDTYTIIIGHRRHAAAKIAGLTELPCIIADMDEKQQLETMLLENMQRSDLTIVEQAQGMQLMIDLGESVDTIATATGLSKQTVKSRVRLNQWNMSDVEIAFSRGATLEDFSKLDKIEDTKEKKKVAKLLGTSNFQWEVEKALKSQRFEKKLPKIIDKLQEAGAVKIKKDPPYEWWDKRLVVSSVSRIEDIIKDNTENRKLQYTVDKQWHEVVVFLMYTDEEIANKRSNPQNKEQSNRELLDKYKRSILKDINQYIDKFIADFNDNDYLSVYHGKAKEKDEIISRLLKMIYAADMEITEYRTPEPITAMKICGFTREKVAEEVEYKDRVNSGFFCRITDKKFLQNIEQNPIKWLLALLRTIIHIDKCTEFYPYSSSYTCVKYKNMKYPRLFVDEIKRLGFEEPDEVKQVIDGTHPMYTEEGCEQILDDLRSKNKEHAE